MQRKPRILIFSEFYLPGYKSGGGMRTVVNMVDRLREHYDLWIAAYDHDGHRDREPYRDVDLSGWNRIGSANVRYYSEGSVGLRSISTLIREVQPAAIYTNSFFTRFTIVLVVLQRLGRLAGIEIILAPCGELSPDALRLRGVKKRIYLILASMLRLYRRVIWKGSSEVEAGDIANFAGDEARIRVVPDLTPRWAESQMRDHVKTSGRSRFICVTRLVPVKNLHWLLELLSSCSDGEIELTLVGPLEDEKYAEECRLRANMLPVNVRVSFAGPIPHEGISAMLETGDFFILPSLSENFGHVLVEAMSVGLPLVISDRTPWRDLEKRGVGWDLSLDDRKDWTRTISRCVQMRDGEYQEMSRRASELAKHVMNNDRDEEATVRLIEEAILGSI